MKVDPQMSKSTMARHSSIELVEAIADVWAAIRHRNPDVPDVFITVGAGSSPRGLKLGHFAAASWVHHDAPADTEAMAELFVGGEGLAGGGVDLLVTLLHEAAHGIAHTRGIQDTSRQGRWHNKNFQRTADELGLAVTKNQTIGWSVSALAETTADRYRYELDRLQQALVAHRLIATDTNSTPKKPTFSASCLCGRRIRLSRTVFDAGIITCSVCGEVFASDLANEETANSTGAPRVGLEIKLGGSAVTGHYPVWGS